MLTSSLSSRVPAALLLLSAWTTVGAQPAHLSDRSTVEAWRAAIARLEPKTPEAWRAAAIGDVEFIDRTLRDNTPIGLVRAVAPIDSNLARGVRVAGERAQRVTSKGGYYHTIVTLGRSIGDPHANVGVYQSFNIGLALPDMWWAGLRVSVEDSVTRVSYVAPSDSSNWKIGDEIVSCDAASLETLAARTVLPFYEPLAGDSRARQRANIPRVFISYENPFIDRPQRCRKRTGEEAPLAWRVRTDEDLRRLPPTAPTTSTSMPMGLTWPANDVAWIRVPTFSGDSLTTARIIDLASVMKRDIERIRNARVIVFDVRGNGGGNSANGSRLVRELWTSDMRSRYGAPLEPVEIAWRASADNLAHWRQYAEEMTARGATGKDNAATGRAVVKGLAQAIEHHDSLWTTHNRGINPAATRDPSRVARPSLFPANVALLSDGTCASACLDFADEVLSMPGTMLLGADTGADGLLMEIRAAPLPSGLMSIAVPMKARVNRKRGYLERYKADVTFDGPWTDDAVVQWVVSQPTLSRP